MALHPLKKVYIDLVREQYGVKLWGDKNPQRTEILAQRVTKTGLGYRGFLKLALELWDRWSRNQEHPYPYWNVVMSDKTFEALGKYTAMMAEIADVDNIDAHVFLIEVEFAQAYIAWLNEDLDLRPRRVINTDTETRIKAAEYICRLYGIEFVSSELTMLARQIRTGQNE
jgi:hypothetical protein